MTDRTAVSDDDAIPDGVPRAAEAASQGGAQWQFIARIAVQASALGLFLLAARVLSVADFGVFTLVQAVSMLLFLVAAGGWREFIMSQTGARAAIDQALSVALLAGLVMALVTALAGLALTRFEPVAGWLLVGFASCVLASPLNNAYAGILVRAGRLKALAMASIAGEAVGFIVGAAGLLAGWNVFALVAAKVTMLAVMLAGNAMASRWPLRFRLRAGHGREIYDYSKQILGNRTVGALGNNAATFIIGAFLGVTEVGYFRAAERVISSVSELIYEPLRLVSWNRFRMAATRAGGEDAEPEALRDALSAEARLLFPLYIAIAAPVFAGLAVVSPEAVNVLLGEKWAPAAPIIVILTLSSIAFVPTTTTEPLLSVAGQIRRILPVLTASTIGVIVILSLLAPYGLVATAWGRVGATLLTMSAIVWLQRDATGASWPGAARACLPVLVAVVAMVGAAYGLKQALLVTDLPVAARLGAEVSLGGLVYVVVLLGLWPGVMKLARSL